MSESTSTTDRSRVHCRRLTKTFGQGDLQVHAVRGVDLELSAGQIVLIMGPSGSGKTTLLTMLGGLLRPTSGEIWINDTDIASLPERELPAYRAHTFGFIFQDFNLLDALDARENVELAANIAGVSGSMARARADELLASLDMSRRAQFRVGKLSGGERQRVAIARALANRPQLILADEPTANLDSGNGAETMRLLRDITHSDGTTVVIASHDERLRELADRVLWLEDGSFRELAQLATDPACGMRLDPEHAPATATIGGIAYWFCSTGCRTQYLEMHDEASPRADSPRERPWSDQPG